MRARSVVAPVVLGAIVALGVLVLASGDAEAAAITDQTKSQVIVGSLDPRTFIVEPATIVTGISDREGTTAAAGSIVLRCREIEGGPAVPPEPDTGGIIIYAYEDDASFGSPGSSTGLLWTQTFTDCEGAGPTFTKFCTSTGLNTGVARFTPVRLVIRAQSTLGAYDVNSDSDGDWGIYRCNPSIASMTDVLGPAGTTVSVYVGGDTIRARLDPRGVPQQASPPTTHGEVQLACNAVERPAQTFQFPADGTTFFREFTVMGSLAEWPDDCTLTHRVVLTADSRISGFTGIRALKWAQANAPSGVTFPDAYTAQRTVTRLVDRTLTSTNCVLTPGVAINRGESATFSCEWRNARSAFVAQDTLASGWIIRPGQPSQDTADFTKGDFTFAASGVGAHTGASHSATTVTPTSATWYKSSVETYGASRTEAELHGFGQTTGQLAVSSTWNFYEITTARQQDPPVTQRAFVVGFHDLHVRPGPLQDVRLEAVAGVNVDCYRTLPNLDGTPGGETEASIDYGNTDSDGRAEFRSFLVEGPVGTWRITCTASGNGNTAERTVEFDETSDLSAHERIAILFNWTKIDESTWNLNVTASLRYFEPDLGDFGRVLKASADLNTPVATTVQCFNPTFDTADPGARDMITVVDGIEMAETKPGTSVYFAEPTIEDSVARECTAYVHATLGGKPTLSETFTTDPPEDFMDVTTAFDAWIPIAIWGGLTLFFLSRDALFPGFASTIATLAAIFPTPIWGRAASVMLVLTTVIVHVAVNRGFRGLFAPSQEARSE